MFFVPMTTIILSGLPHTAVPPASGLSNFLRITAGAFGASIATTFWDNRASLHHARLAEHVNAYDPATAMVAPSIGRRRHQPSSAYTSSSRQTSTAGR